MVNFSSREERMANQTGKRHVCAKCRTEMLVTKGGSGSLSCCGQPMQLRGTSAQAAPQASKTA